MSVLILDSDYDELLKLRRKNRKNKKLQEKCKRLTNNWNELEEWVKSNLGNCRTNIKYEIGNEYIIKEDVYHKMLDKMKEIKEGNNV